MNKKKMKLSRKKLPHRGSFFMAFLMPVCYNEKNYAGGDYLEFLYLLEDIRMPVLNECMLLITALGEETAFLVMALIFFWCVDKRRGYLLMSVGFVGTMANQFLKMCFRIPRPWVLDENFTILEEAREAATGYSFPSGHTTSAVGTFGSIAVSSKKRSVRVCCVLLAVAVGISRMYVGVHTPADVLAGAATSVIAIFALRRICLEDNGMKPLLAAMLAMAVGLLLFMRFFPFPEGTDAHNLESGLKNAYTMIGCMTGVWVVYGVEKRCIRFTTDALWWAQILKAVLGLGLVLLVKEGLRAPLEAVFGGHLIARSVRYFLIVVAAGLLWPLSFRWFSRLGRKAVDA